jgi:hypothetical protein
MLQTWMKTFSSILIVIVTMHAACAGRCLGSHLGAPARNEATPQTPPCHKAANVPEPEKPKHPDDNGACAQASLFDAKIKAGPQDWSFDAVMPAVSPVATLDEMRRTAFATAPPLDTSPPLISLRVLRI